MATHYTTATLGLAVDTKAFQRELGNAQGYLAQTLQGMKLSADSFQLKWDSLTAGIKDTKRIISGILVSRAFYSLSGAIEQAASSLFTFAQNMETAEISMEYFVGTSDKTAKSLAYLREMYDFAARTPFSTESALSLSKYAQAMGVSIETTESFLNVITDTAAATGATTENLQRITLALGQMMTKGRLAGEEIRQLANANIPIYEILQEELGLTGKQISKIGKYWVDADMAVEAILRGLEKRYKGAADKIADTVTGMLDTLADDAVIIGQQATRGLYEGFASGLSKIRDKVEEWRKLVTEMGGPALFQDIVMEIDPSGKLLEWLLVTYGNVKQLIASLKELYLSAQPLINVFGRSLATSINVAAATMTAFAKTLDGALEVLEKAGVTTGQLGDALAKLYIGYQAAKIMMSLGEAAYFAAGAVAQAVTSIFSITSASAAASGGLLGLAGSFIAVAAAAAGAYYMISKLSNFAGISDAADPLSGWNTAMEDYQAKMKAYNDAIAKYQEDYRHSYDEISDSAAAAVDEIDSTSKKNKKAASQAKQEWVATFDEVYAIPSEKNGSGSDADTTEFPDIGDLLLDALKFKFPDTTKLEMPKFDLDKAFDDSLWDLEDGMKSWLPAIITAGVLGAALGLAKAFARAQKKMPIDINVEGTTIKISNLDDTIKAMNELAEKLMELNSQAAKLLANGSEALPGAENTRGLPGDNYLDQAKKLRDGVEELKKLRAAAVDVTDDVRKIPGGVEEIERRLLASADQLEQIGLETKLRELQHTLDNNTSLSIAEQDKIRAQIAQTRKELAKLVENTSVDPKYAKLSDQQLIRRFETLGADLREELARLASAREVRTEQLPEGNFFNKQTLEELRIRMNEFIRLGEHLEAQALKATSTAADGLTEAQRLYSLLEGQKKNIATSFQQLLDEKKVSGKNDQTQLIRNIGLEARRISDSVVAEGVLSRKLGEVNKQLAEIKAADAERLKAEKKRLAIEADKAAKQSAYESVAGSLDHATAAKFAEEFIAELRNTTGTPLNVASLAEAEQALSDACDRLNEAFGETGTNAWHAGVADATKQLLEPLHEYIGLLGTGVPSQEIIEKLEEISELIGAAQDSKGEHYGWKGFLVDQQKLIQSAWEDVGNAIVELSDAANKLADAGDSIVDATAKQAVVAGNLRNALHKAVAAQLGYVDAITANTAALLVERTAGTVTEADIYGLFAGSGTFGTATTPVLRQLITDGITTGLAVRDSDYLLTMQGMLSRQVADIERYVVSRILVGAHGYDNVGTVGLIRAGDSILTLDGIAKGVYGGMQSYLPIQFFTMGSNRLASLTEAAGEIVGGLGDINANVLRAVNPQAWAELGASVQAIRRLSSQMATNATGIVAILNKNFDIKGTELADRFAHYMMTMPYSYELFNAETAIEYAITRGFADADIDTIVSRYVSEVLMPTLGVGIADWHYGVNGITDAGFTALANSLAGTFAPLKDAVTLFTVSFPKDVLNALDPAKLAASSQELINLISGAKAAAKEAGKELPPALASLAHNYVIISKNAGRFANTLLQVDFNSAVRTYTKARDGMNQWAQALLDTTEKFSKAPSGEFVGLVDTAMADYFTAIRAAVGDARPAAMESTRAALREIAANTTAYFDSASDAALASRALFALADQLEGIDPTAYAVRHYIDAMNDINAAIAANMPVTGELLRTFEGMTHDASKLIDEFGMAAEDYVVSYVRNLEKLSRLLNDAAKSDATKYVADVLGSRPLNGLFRAANIEETVQSAYITLAKEMGKELEAGVNAPKLPAELAAAVKRGATGKESVIDFEMLGLFEATSEGVAAPSGFSASVYNPLKNSLDSFYMVPDDIYEAVKAGSEHAESMLDEWIRRMASVGPEFRKIYGNMKAADIIDKVLNRNEAIKKMTEWMQENPNGWTAYNGTNIGRVGGGYDFRALESFGLGDVARQTMAGDVMTAVTDILRRYTQGDTTMKLTELKEALAISDDDIAKLAAAISNVSHTSDTDVLVTYLVHQAATNGKLEKIVADAAGSGFKVQVTNKAGNLVERIGEVKKSIIQTGQQLYGKAEEVRRAIPTSNTTAQTVFNIDNVAFTFDDGVSLPAALQKLYSATAEQLEKGLTFNVANLRIHVEGTTVKIEELVQGAYSAKVFEDLATLKLNVGSLLEKSFTNFEKAFNTLAEASDEYSKVLLSVAGEAQIVQQTLTEVERTIVEMGDWTVEEALRQSVENAAKMQAALDAATKPNIPPVQPGTSTPVSDVINEAGDIGGARIGAMNDAGGPTFNAWLRSLLPNLTSAASETMGNIAKALGTSSSKVAQAFLGIAGGIGETGKRLVGRIGDVAAAIGSTKIGGGTARLLGGTTEKVFDTLTGAGTGKTSGTTFTGGSSQAAEAATEGFDATSANGATWYKRWTNKSGWKNTMPSIDDIFESLDSMYALNETYIEDIGMTLAEARRLKNLADTAVAGGASKNADWIVEAYSNYNKALKHVGEAGKSYADLSADFYDNLIRWTAGATSQSKNVESFANAVGLLDDDTKYIAYKLTKDKGLELLGDSITLTGRQIKSTAMDAAAEAVAAAKVLGDGVDATKAVQNAFDLLENYSKALGTGNSTLIEAAEQAIKQADSGTTAAIKLLREINAINQGFQGLDQASDAAKLYFASINALGDSTVIIDVSNTLADGVKVLDGIGDAAEEAGKRVVFAGASASKLVDGAADTVALSFKSLGVKLVKGVANFGIIDVAAAVLQGVMQHIKDTQNAKSYQQVMEAFDTSGIVAQIAAGTDKTSGYLLGEAVGNEVFHGALQETGFGIVTGVTSSLAVTLAGAITSALAHSALGMKIAGTIGSAAGPLGTAAGIAVGAIVGIVTGLITNAAIDALGGHTNTNLYLDDYIRALNSGGVITDEMVLASATALGWVDENGQILEEYAAQMKGLREQLEETARKQLRTITMGSADYSNRLERDDINNVLFGGYGLDRTKYEVVDDKKQLTYKGADLALRLAAAIGAFDTNNFRRVMNYVPNESDSEAYGRVDYYYALVPSYYGPNGEVVHSQMPGSSFKYDENGRITVDNVQALLSHGLTVHDADAIVELQKLLGVQLEIREVELQSGTRIAALYDATNNRFLQGDLSNIEALSEVLKLMYTQGNQTSDFVKIVQETLAANPYLANAVKESVGVVAANVFDNMSGYLKLYNSLAGTDYKQSDLDNNAALGSAIFEWASKTLDLGMADFYAQIATKGAAYKESSGRSQVFWGATLDDVSGNVLEALDELGFSLKGMSTEVTPTLTDAFQQAYVQLTQAADKFDFSNIEGFRVDWSKLKIDGVTLDKAVISTKDAQILAQAGIQINADGTVDFMKADLSGRSGDNRQIVEFSVSSISNQALEYLKEHGITLNFDADGSGTNMQLAIHALEKQAAGVVFKLPDGWDNFASKQVKNALNGIGKVLDSGYLEITDTSFLNGEKSIKEYIAGLNLAGSNAKVDDALASIDAMIKAGLEAESHSWAEYADAIVIPSIFTEDQLTPEIRAMFAQAGITFVEQEQGLMMVVQNTGNHFKAGITEVARDTWEQLDSDTVQALQDMGVTWTVEGTKVMVDVSGAYETGIDNIIDLFVNRPEVWDQIPESVKQYLADTVVETENGFLDIKRVGDGCLVEINGSWVTSWEQINKEVDGIVGVNGTLPRDINKGLIQVAGFITDADIPNLAENEIAVPFADLPPELQKSLTALNTEFESPATGLVKLKNITATEFGSIVSTFQTSEGSITTSANNIVQQMTDAVVQAGVQLQQLQSLQSKFGSSGGLFGSGIFGKGNSMGKLVNVSTSANGWDTQRYGETITVVSEIDSSGKVVGYWWQDENGAWKKLSQKPVGFASGGTVGGTNGEQLTLTGELGREMAILPDGSIKMLGANGRGELLDLPKGTRILNNEDTENVLKYTGSISKLSSYADGNTDLVIEDGVQQDDVDQTAASVDTLTTALHGFAAQLFEFLEKWRDTNAGVAGTVATSMNSYSDKIVNALSSIRNSQSSFSLPGSITSDLSQISNNTSNLSTTLSQLMSSLSRLSTVPDAVDGVKTSVKNTENSYLNIIAMAKEMWNSSNDPAVKELAHTIAELARATQGYSGGPDGSEHILLENAAETVKALQSQVAEMLTKQIEQGGIESIISDDLKAKMTSDQQEATNLLTTLADMLRNWSAQDQSDVAQLLAGIDSAAGSVASVLGSFASWTSSQIESLQNAVSALQWSASVAERSAASKSTKGSAKGSLVTEDALYRVGELGLNEAIIPLEQPDVMALVGEAIADSMPETTVDVPAGTMALVGEALADSMPDAQANVIVQENGGLDVEQVDTLTTAIRGAVAAICENQDIHFKEVIDRIGQIINTVDTDLKALNSLENLTNANNGLRESISGLQTNVGKIAESLGSITTQLDFLINAAKELATEPSVQELGDSVDAIPGDLAANLAISLANWYVDTINSARTEFAAATNDAEKAAAHAKAETARSLFGFSGGPDGSQHIATGTGVFGAGEDGMKLLQQIIEQIQAGDNKAYEQSDKQQASAADFRSKLFSALDDDSRKLLTELGENATKSLLGINSNGQGIIAAIQSGCAQVAAAVGSYVQWSQSRIASLESTISAMQAAASAAERSASGTGVGKNTKGSASGSLVTEDALYRAGELGLKEAIIPLERPEVLSLVGEAIADSMPGGSEGASYDINYEPTIEAAPADDQYDITEQQATTVEAIYQQTDTLTTAIHGLVAAILDGQDDFGDRVATKVDAISSTVGDKLGKLEALDTLTRSMDELGGDIDGMSNIAGKLDTTVDKLSAQIEQGLDTITNVAESILRASATEDTLAMLPEELGTVVSRELVAKAAEQIAAAKIDFGNATTDEEKRAAHAKAEEARSWLGYSGGDDGSEYISLFEAQTNETNNQLKIIGDLQTSANSTMVVWVDQKALLEQIKTEQIAELSKDHQTMVQLSSTWWNNLMSYLASMTNSLGSTIVSAANSVASAVGSYVRYAETTMASQRAQISSLQSALSSAMAASASKGSTKGSASGSLVTKDALYRAGELGLNEAIIPLERPDVLTQVGSAIAAFMPSNVQQLSAVAGMTNAGVVMPAPYRPQSVDSGELVSTVTQHVLEAVLPQMQQNDDDGENRRPLYVGTLIADDRGLRTLERKLYDIRQAEATRR